MLQLLGQAQRDVNRLLVVAAFADPLWQFAQDLLDFLERLGNPFVHHRCWFSLVHLAISLVVEDGLGDIADVDLM